jgi:hypothetical protein
MTISNMQLAGVLLALAAAAPAAQAQYRCTDGSGRVSYQQTPCMPGQQGSGKPLAPVPSAPAENGVRPVSPYAADIARFAREDKVKAAIAEKRLFVGMTEAEVVASWGAPAQKNRFTSGDRVVVQWVYPAGAGERHVEFSEGRVDAIQEYNIKK